VSLRSQEKALSGRVTAMSLGGFYFLPAVASRFRQKQGSGLADLFIWNNYSSEVYFL
jgi:hypothetical protein